MLRADLHDGIALRLFDEADARELYALIAANRAFLARWLPWPDAQTLAGTLEFIRLTRRQLADNDGLQTAITIDGRIAGAIGVHGISWHHERTSLGYWLAEEFQGRGAMTAAVRRYTDHAFDVWRLHRVEIEAAVENHRSRRVPERLGFRQEGVRRQVERVGPRRHDLVVYGMLAPEWRARPT